MSTSDKCPECDKTTPCAVCTRMQHPQFKMLSKNILINSILNSDMSFQEKLDRVLDIVHRI